MTNVMNDKMLTEDEFFEHAGVKGMKWGQRKSAKTSSNHTSADAARFNKIGSRVKKNGFDNLSNDDLAKLNKRSQLLTEYKKNNPSKVAKGAKAAKDALDKYRVGKDLAVAGVAVYALAKNPKVRAGALKVASIIKNM